MKERSGKLKVVYIAPEMIVALLTVKQEDLSCIEGLPEGAKLMGAYMDHGNLALVFHHDTFEQIDCGITLPILSVVYRRYWRENVQP